MIIHKDRSHTIYFGSRTHAFNPMPHRDKPQLSSGQLCAHPSFKSINSRELYFLKQTHSTHGYLIDQSAQLKPFSLEGDYLITQQPSIALGVLTADCLPVIIYDKHNHAAGIAHAGWRGAVSGVIQAMYAHMQKSFGTQAQDLFVYFGPSAHVCCYQVSDEFISHVGDYSESLIKKNNSSYFDLPLYASGILTSLGIPEEALDQSYASCTICDLSMCSYRRDPDKSLRQFSIIVLR